LICAVSGLLPACFQAKVTSTLVTSFSKDTFNFSDDLVLLSKPISLLSPELAPETPNPS
jgi:hypothetical protein